MTQTLPLFAGIPAEAPHTEGIKYAGSKLKLLPHILRLASRTNGRTVLDAFAGTTRVSQAFAKMGYSVICNDIAVWTEVFGTAYLLNQRPRAHYQPLIDHLNGLSPVDGWFTDNYGGAPGARADGPKRPWQVHNTRKLDAIREEIDRLPLSAVERAVAITSLVLAMDQVDSTLGHFASYLRDWSPRSRYEMSLRVPALFESTGTHQVARRDASEFVAEADADVAYLDPPYGSNNEKMPPSRVRYAAYYHLWATVCLNDRPPLFGKAMRRVDTSDRFAGSVFEDFRKSTDGRFLAVQAIEALLAATKARYIILSYSSGGRATAAELNAAIRAHGELVEAVQLDHKRNVMAGMRWTDEWVRRSEQPNTEFLFLLAKA